MREFEGVTLYTVPEAAAALNVTAQTIRRYVKDGLLKAQRVGRPFLITGESLRRFVSGSSEASQPEAAPTNGASGSRAVVAS